MLVWLPTFGDFAVTSSRKTESTMFANLFAYTLPTPAGGDHQ